MTTFPPENGSRRAPACGADLPSDDAAARERLLIAAEACYAEMGPARTKITHIAEKAGVHRTTVYSYFPDRDAIFEACYVRATTVVLEASEPCWSADKPFMDRLVDACLVGFRTAHDSPVMRALIRQDDLPHTYAVAQTSDQWRARLLEGMGRHLADAVAHGEVRGDLPVEMMANWVIRVGFSFMAEPGRPEDGGDEGVMRAFLIKSLAP
jgi:AcrR family transcriptional regulator